MKAKLMKQGDRYVLYAEGGHKIACTSDNPYKKLSLKNCQAIELGYDLDELANEYYSKLEVVPYKSNGFKAGFQKALEILGDKKFSEDDLEKAIVYHTYLQHNDGLLENGETADIRIDKAIQSIQQNEWEVEIVMEDVMIEKVRSMQFSAQRAINAIEAGMFPKPKLDADGCLILKRVV